MLNYGPLVLVIEGCISSLQFSFLTAIVINKQSLQGFVRVSFFFFIVVINCNE